MAEKIVEARGLTRRFGNAQALVDVDYDVTAGKVHGLVGPNGSGKTTLIKHVLGLLRPSAGTVRVFGVDPVRDPVGVLGRIGYLSERRELPDWMTVGELVRYTRAYYPGWDDDYANELVEQFGLEPAKKVGTLSDGMRARAGLIMAVAHRPKLLLLDEPSSGLDPIVREDILAAIVRTIVDDGRTVVFSSHLLDEVERMSDHVTMIHEGRIVLDGALDDLKHRHQRTEGRLSVPMDRLPHVDGVLSLEGSGRSWSILHACSLEALESWFGRIGAEVVQSRDATLQEIFVARAQRDVSARLVA